MEFETQAQQAVYQKIEPWLKEKFGIFFQRREDAPYFGVSIGSAFVHIGIQPWTSENASVTVRAYVVINAQIQPDLLLFLLRENDKLRFGAFGLDEDNDIFFEHSLPGLSCTADELAGSILAVGQTTDQYDDVITARWGGVPAAEMQSED
ncbi:MAG: YbjN domain-containing protein [Anaerolineaceae bacterium]